MLTAVAHLAAFALGYLPLPDQGCPAQRDFGHGHHAEVGVLAGCAADEAPGRLIRGGAPSEAGLACLRQQGVTTVIDLRTEGEARGARGRAEAHGLAYQRFGMVTRGARVPRECGGATADACNARSVDGAIAAIESALAAAPDARVYLHCARGEDRTGLVIAALRLRQRCPVATVRREMLKHGYYPYPPLEAVWSALTRPARPRRPSRRPRARRAGGGRWRPSRRS